MEEAGTPHETGNGNPMGGMAEEALRYARQGNRFVELALMIGEVRAKNRVRGEWQAYFYASQMGRSCHTADTGFDRASGGYRKKIWRRRPGYFRYG